MTELLSTDRGRYRPSGGVDLPRFAPLAAAVVLAAALCAWLLWLGFEHRFYAPLVFTLGAAMAVGGLALLAVRLGHCRSRPAAFVLGLVAGLLIQPGHHLLAYLADRGPGAVADPAGFARHLDRRLAEVEVEWGAPPRLDDDEEVEPSRADYLFLWAVTALEIVLIPLLCALPPLLRVVRDPYCETGGRWAERIRLAFHLDAEEALIAALAEGRLAAVAAAAVTEPHPNRPSLLGLLDVCPGPSTTGVAGYLSLRRRRGDAAAAIAMEPLVPYYRLRLRCAALDAGEVAALRALVPEGERSTAAVAPSWVLETVAEELRSRDLARLESVDQSHPPPAADRRTRRLAEFLNLAPLLGCVAVGFGLLWAAASAEDGSIELASVLGVSGIAVMIAGVWLAVMDQRLVGDRYLFRRLVRRLAGRPDLRVRPEDPDALKVALVPRSVWAGGRGQELVDYGLLAVRDAVLYEGDRHRMEIPAAAIREVSFEPLTVDQFQTWHFVVLEVQAADGLHTLPFVRVAAPLGETLFVGKKRRARVLSERILGLSRLAV